MERIAASIGNLQSVEPQFYPALDVPFGGVMLALPALLACGLLAEAEKYFKLPRGYYGLHSIFLLLAFMALARIKTIEDLRYCAPGEWGKLLGLDRIPEVRTLREKLNLLSRDGQSEEWGAKLCSQWIESDESDALIFYIDGHVRVYYGSQTELPKHYVAREKLCLRATVDYWVNAMNGCPFFFINKAVDPGLLHVIENDIVPRLEKEVPLQAGVDQLDKNIYWHRFTLIFDREGYSPDFMKRMKEKHIACITYNKYPKEVWSEEEFRLCQLTNVFGNIIESKLAERGVRLSNKLWVREVRKLSTKGKQVSILSTDYSSDLQVIASEIADRWTQENFFKYMRQHYNLDRLIDYSLEPIPDTIKVVNPEFRRLDGKIRSLAAKCSQFLAKFGAIQLKQDIEPNQVEKYQMEKSAVQEEIKSMQLELESLKRQRKQTTRHALVSELPDEEKFSQLACSSKHFVDTIKMVAYRAETAMVNILREKMSRADDGRKLLKAIYQTEVDLLPDEKNKILNVRLHHLANHCSDRSIRHICDELNATNTIFPGTELRLFFNLGAEENP